MAFDELCGCPLVGPCPAALAPGTCHDAGIPTPPIPGTGHDAGILASLARSPLGY